MWSEFSIHTPSTKSPQWKVWNVSTSSPWAHFCRTNVALNGGSQIQYYQKIVSLFCNNVMGHRRTWSTKRIGSLGGTTKWTVVGVAISKKQSVSKNNPSISMNVCRWCPGMYTVSELPPMRRVLPSVKSANRSRISRGTFWKAGMQTPMPTWGSLRECGEQECSLVEK